MSEYLPKLVGIDKACEWLAKRTGDEWSLERLLECGLSPYFWLDWTEDTAPIFSGRTEGMLVYACFASDSARLVALGKDFRVTMFLLENDKIVKCGPPGIPVPLEEIRFKREDLAYVASATQSKGPTDYLSKGVSVGIDVADYDAPPELAVMREAIKKFWVNADRSKPPKGEEEIIPWIRDRVDSDSKAKAIDLLIRPEWARKGGSKKWAKG